MKFTRCPLLALAVGLAWPVFAADDLNWPEFRGPRGDGITTSTGLPVTWSETAQVKWKTPIHGRAWSSPVIWGNQIWLDLLCAAATAFIVLLPRARAAGMAVWVWLAFLIATGSLGLLAMLARCLWLEGRARQG